MIIGDLPPTIPTAHIEQVQEKPIEKARRSAFLTYAHDDPRFVNEVNVALKAADVKTYLDKEFISIGNIDDQIIAAIKKVQYQIIFCTISSSNSEYCRNEIMFARARGAKQIPIIIDPMEKMDWFSFIRLDLYLSVYVDGFEDMGPAIYGITRELLRIINRATPL